MKRLTTITFLLAITASVLAQTGTIVYNETRKLAIHVDGMTPEMMAMFPKERKSTHLLYFTPEASLYVNQKQSDDQEVNQEIEGGGNMEIRMQEPDEKIYLDNKEQRYTEQRDFMGRMFLIESRTDTIPWKLTDARKEILGITCMGATYSKDTLTFTAWFAPSIPVSSGPAKYWGLPGLILEVSDQKGDRVITAASVYDTDVSKLLVKPKQGKKVTNEEFKAIVEEKSKETGGGKDGNMIMIKVTK